MHYSRRKALAATALRFLTLFSNVAYATAPDGLEELAAPYDPSTNTWATDAASKLWIPGQRVTGIQFYGIPGEPDANYTISLSCPKDATPVDGKAVVRAFNYLRMLPSPSVVASQPLTQYPNEANATVACGEPGAWPGYNGTGGPFMLNQTWNSMGSEKRKRSGRTAGHERRQEVEGEWTSPDQSDGSSSTGGSTPLLSAPVPKHKRQETEGEWSSPDQSDGSSSSGGSAPLSSSPAPKNISNVCVRLADVPDQPIQWTFNSRNPIMTALMSLPGIEDHALNCNFAVRKADLASPDWGIGCIGNATVSGSFTCPPHTG